MTSLKTKNETLCVKEFAVPEPSAVIGRNPDCEIQLNNNTISRRHARIGSDSLRFWIEDLGSSNGTLVNGESFVGKKTLYDGDAVRFGHLDFIFESGLAKAHRPSEPDDNRNFFWSILSDEEPDHPFSVDTLFDLNTPSSSRVPQSTSLNLAAQVAALQAKLDVITRLIKSLGRMNDSGELLSQFLENLLGLYPQADFSSLLAPNRQTKQLEIIDFKARHKRAIPNFRICRSLPQMVFREKKALLSNDIAMDDRFNVSDSMIQCRICSIMAVPIMEPSEEEPLAVIQIDARSTGRKFTDVDLDLLVEIANLIGVYHENLRYQEIRHQEEKLSQEMSVAHQVQQGFLPKKKPELDRYEFYDFYRPAKYLGGDYFDYIPMPDGRIAVILGDVSGKGISAALLMAKLSSEVRFSLLLEKTLPAAMKRINSVYCGPEWGGRFVTLALAVLDPEKNRLSLLNAGHLYPLCRHPNGTVEEIGVDCQGFPIGIMPDAEYEEITYDLKPRDSVLLMSDGLTDAMDSAGQYFEMKRILACLEESRENGAAVIGTKLMEAVHQYAGETPQSDDQCLVVLGRK